MSKQMEANSPTTFPPAVQAFWKSGTQTADSAIRNYTAWLSDFSRLQNESLRFLNTRLSEDCQAAVRLAACRTPAEALDFQVGYVHKVVTEFRAEGRKIFELCGQLATSDVPKQP